MNKDRNKHTCRAKIWLDSGCGCAFCRVGARRRKFAKRTMRRATRRISKEMCNERD